MIELNGIYKLKHIKGHNCNSTDDFKVVGFSEDKRFVGCKQLNGEEAGKGWVFYIECLIDPEKPDDIYYGEIVSEWYKTFGNQLKYAVMQSINVNVNKPNERNAACKKISKNY